MPDEQVPQPEPGDPGDPWQPPVTGPAPATGPAPVTGPGPGAGAAAGSPPEGYQPAHTYHWPAQGSAPWPWPNQGGWAQSPASPSARPSRVRAVVVGSVVAVAAALIAGAAGYEIGLQHSRISAAVQTLKAAAGGPCPAGETAPGPSATSPAGAALLTRLLPMPAGDRQVTAEKQGVLSMSDYLNELFPGNAAAQQRLTTLCFQTAAHRTWQSPSGITTSVWLIQFGTAADARSYTLATEQADAADPANSDKFEVSRVTDGMGLGRPALDKYGNTLTRLLGDAGTTSVIIHVFIPARTNNAAAALVLQEQTALLNAG